MPRMLNIVVFSLTLSASVSAMAAPETVVVPDRYYDGSGKLLCSNEGGVRCPYNRAALITMWGGELDAPELKRYEKLRQAFIAEAVRQYQALQKLNPKALVANYKAGTDCGGGYNGLTSCKLHDIVKQRGKPGADSWRHRWRFRGGFINTDVQTPWQGFGPYSKPAKHKLVGLQKEFLAECFRQQSVDEIAGEPKLLKIALRASAVMFGNLQKAKRNKLLASWNQRCAADDEDPRDTTIRFLLSQELRPHRGYKGNVARGGDAAWTCPAWGSLYSTNNCGTVLYWAAEEKKPNVTRSFRGIIPTLKEVK